MALTPEEYLLQSKVVNGGVDENPGLASSANPASHSKLNTTEKKSTLKAVNEIVNSKNSVATTVNNILDQSIEVVGDWVSDPALESDMKLVGDNILDTIPKMCDNINKIAIPSKTDLAITDFPKIKGKINKSSDDWEILTIGKGSVDKVNKQFKIKTGVGDLISGPGVLHQFNNIETTDKGQIFCYAPQNSDPIKLIKVKYKSTVASTGGDEPGVTVYTVTNVSGASLISIKEFNGILFAITVDGIYRYNNFTNPSITSMTEPNITFHKCAINFMITPMTNFSFFNKSVVDFQNQMIQLTSTPSYLDTYQHQITFFNDNNKICFYIIHNDNSLEFFISDDNGYTFYKDPDNIHKGYHTETMANKDVTYINGSGLYDKSGLYKICPSTNAMHNSNFYYFDDWGPNNERVIISFGKLNSTEYKNRCHIYYIDSGEEIEIPVNIELSSNSSSISNSVFLYRNKNNNSIVFMTLMNCSVSPSWPRYKYGDNRGTNDSFYIFSISDSTRIPVITINFSIYNSIRYNRSYEVRGNKLLLSLYINYENEYSTKNSHWLTVVNLETLEIQSDTSGESVKLFSDLITMGYMGTRNGTDNGELTTDIRSLISDNRTPFVLDKLTAIKPATISDYITSDGRGFNIKNFQLNNNSTLRNIPVGFVVKKIIENVIIGEYNSKTYFSYFNSFDGLKEIFSINTPSLLRYIINEEFCDKSDRSFEIFIIDNGNNIRMITNDNSLDNVINLRPVLKTVVSNFAYAFDIHRIQKDKTSGKWYLIRRVNTTTAKLEIRTGESLETFLISKTFLCILDHLRPCYDNFNRLVKGKFLYPQLTSGQLGYSNSIGVIYCEYTPANTIYESVSIQSFPTSSMIMSIINISNKHIITCYSSLDLKHAIYNYNQITNYLYLIPNVSSFVGKPLLNPGDIINESGRMIYKCDNNRFSYINCIGDTNNLDTVHFLTGGTRWLNTLFNFPLSNLIGLRFFRNDLTFFSFINPDSFDIKSIAFEDRLYDGFIEKDIIATLDFEPEEMYLRSPYFNIKGIITGKTVKFKTYRFFRKGVMDIAFVVKYHGVYLKSNISSIRIPRMHDFSFRRIEGGTNVVIQSDLTCDSRFEIDEIYPYNLKWTQDSEDPSIFRREVKVFVDSSDVVVDFNNLANNIKISCIKPNTPLTYEYNMGNVVSGSSKPYNNDRFIIEGPNSNKPTKGIWDYSYDFNSNNKSISFKIHKDDYSKYYGQLSSIQIYTISSNGDKGITLYLSSLGLIDDYYVFKSINSFIHNEVMPLPFKPNKVKYGIKLDLNALGNHIFIMNDENNVPPFDIVLPLSLLVLQGITVYNDSMNIHRVALMNSNVINSELPVDMIVNGVTYDAIACEYKLPNAPGPETLNISFKVYNESKTEFVEFGPFVHEDTTAIFSITDVVFDNNSLVEDNVTFNSTVDGFINYTYSVVDSANNVVMTNTFDNVSVITGVNRINRSKSVSLTNWPYKSIIQINSYRNSKESYTLNNVIFEHTETIVSPTFSLTGTWVNAKTFNYELTITNATPEFRYTLYHNQSNYIEHNILSSEIDVNGVAIISGQLMSNGIIELNTVLDAIIELSHKYDKPAGYYVNVGQLQLVLPAMDYVAPIVETSAYRGSLVLGDGLAFIEEDGTIQIQDIVIDSDIDNSFSVNDVFYSDDIAYNDSENVCAVVPVGDSLTWFDDSAEGGDATMSNTIMIIDGISINSIEVLGTPSTVVGGDTGGGEVEAPPR